MYIFIPNIVLILYIHFHILRKFAHQEHVPIFQLFRNFFHSFLSNFIDAVILESKSMCIGYIVNRICGYTNKELSLRCFKGTVS
jgi:hypothetical protein